MTKKIKTNDPNWVKPKTHLGASQFAAALGLSIFLSPEDLTHRLEHGYRWEGSASTKFGHQKEKLAKYFYSKLTKNKIRRAYFVKDLKYPRLVGICDGLVGNEGGVEIKCHYNKGEPLREIPIYYLVQVAGYLNLYNRVWWDFMSCCFNEVDQICKCKIIRVYREDIQDAWENEWLPQLLDFINRVQWKLPVK